MKLSKNIHVLSTDKPSRLYYHSELKQLVLTNKIILRDVVANQNIYITSDEEIKFDEYYLGEDNNTYCLVSSVNYNGKKIILTTDQNLIADGVQSIDDKFLEWFVKNPSCEEVETVYKIIDIEKATFETAFDKVYKIIIPKEEPKQLDIRELNRLDDIEIEEMSNDWDTMQQQEEPKQENCCTPVGQIKRYVDCKGCDTKPFKHEVKVLTTKEEPKQGALNHFLSTSNVIVKDPQKWDFNKQETLEEVAEKRFPSKMEMYDVFIEGAKWQQQKDRDFYFKYIKSEKDFQIPRMDKLGINTTGQIFEQMVTSLIHLGERSYSEEEVKLIINDIVEKHCTYFEQKIKDDIKLDWFEQFKKK